MTVHQQDLTLEHLDWEAAVLPRGHHPANHAFLKEYSRELKDRKAGLWGMLRRRGVGDAIAEPTLNLELRVFLLATTRAMPGGHAIFVRGELLAALPKVAKTGEVGEFSHRHLRNVVDNLIAVGLLGESSTFPPNGTACLVLPEAIYRIDLRYGAQPCPVHGHSLSWAHGQWFDPSMVEPSLNAIGKAASVAADRN